MIFGAPHPRVGLLSIRSRGPQGQRTDARGIGRSAKASAEFCGNVEGRDLYNGRVDVIVCDGFIGNVALKISEGMVEAISMLLREALASTLSSKVGYMLARKALRGF